MKKFLDTLLIIMIILTGLSLFLYPTVSNYLSEQNGSQAIDGYTENVSVLDEGASAEVAQKLREVALACPNVISIHGFRTRYVGSDLHVDLHVVVPADMTLLAAHDLAEEVERRIIDAGENVVDALVHIDPYDPKKV